MTTLVMIDLQARQYFAFHGALRPDPRLPPTWEEWRRISQAEEKDHQAVGYKTVRMPVDFAEFFSYSATRGPVTYSLMQVYVNHLYRDRSTRGQAARKAAMAKQGPPDATGSA